MISRQAMVKPVTLVAMAPSGATLLVRDTSDRTWLCPSPGAGQPCVIDPERVEQVIARGDLERIDREFASWEELDAFRQERARRVTPQTIVDIDSFDAHDVERHLAVAERWLAEGDAERPRKLAFRLLRTPVAHSDAEVHERLVNLLERLGQPVLSLRSTPRTPLQAAARERWQLQRAA
jgi:hypothetical protein